MQKKFFAGVCALVLAAVAAGCSQNADTTTNPNNTASNMTAQTRTGPDNTEIITESSNGVTTETRTFKDPNSRVERVVVTTRDGKRTARVYYRDKTERDLNDNEVEHALDATGEALVKVGSTVADKVEDVPHEVDDAGRAVGDKAEDVGSATVKGAKKVGSVVGDKAEDVGSATVNGAKKAGKATAKGAKKVGRAVKNAVTP